MLKIPNIMDIKERWPPWFINDKLFFDKKSFKIFLIKRLKAVVSHLKINLLSNLHLKMNN